MPQQQLSCQELDKYKQVLLNDNMLFELSVVSQMIVNHNRYIIRVNKKFSELFGYDTNEILGKKTSVLTPSKEKFYEYEKYFTQTKEGIVTSEELLYKNKKGNLFWTKLEGITFSIEEEKAFVLWSFINIDKEVKYREELKLLASIDPMSGLYNRRFFSDMAENIVALAKRQKRNVCIILLDIDNFKSINDTYGHDVGDDVIKKLSRVLKDNTRKSDILCRYGGEEFILLLPETSLQWATKIADDLRLEFNSYKFTLHEKQISFTASFGVSTLDIRLESALEDGIKRADKALYRAKNSGKNQVVVN